MTKNLPVHKTRRGLLLWGAAALPLSPGCSLNLRGLLPPDGRLKRIAVVPSINVACKDSICFGGTAHPDYADPPGSVSPAALAATAGSGSGAEARARQAAAKIALVGCDPARRLDARLVPALREAGLDIVAITAHPLADQVREGLYAGLPAGVDAVVDVRFVEAGYRWAPQAGGFTPFISAAVSLHAAADGRRLHRQWLGAGPAQAGTDTHWITTPAQLTVASVEAFEGRAAELRAGLDEVVDRMRARLVQDLKRRAAQPDAPDD
jgi:hypothetical protein